MCSVVESLDWQAVERSLDADGFARLPALMAPDQCGELAALYTDDARFRSRIDMARFRFGVGEYKHFASPLPLSVRPLREELYARLAPIDKHWPRAQSRGHALAIEQGAGVIFATSQRPVAGSRGTYRVVMRHGVSTIRSGARMSLGIIFHDAK